MESQTADRTRSKGNSLKKGGKDAIQGRSWQETSPMESNTARDGKATQFTVGSVGNNGRIYLRYVLVDHI